MKFLRSIEQCYRYVKGGQRSLPVIIAIDLTVYGINLQIESSLQSIGMRYLFVVAGSLCYLLTFSQSFPPQDYPRGYFRNPLDIPMSLAANFGELRPNHYHMGLDIRTQKKENLPVF